MKWKGILEAMDYISENIIDEEYLKKNLSEKRFNHTLGVVDEVKKLCAIYNGDETKCVIAAKFHDIVREKDIDTINSLVKKYGLADKYLTDLNIAHGKVAAEMMKDQWHITDKEILNAVSFHTTGRANMTKTEKILFIADAIEPSRDYEGVQSIREITYKDLDKGCLKAIENTLGHLRKKGIKNIDEDTIEAEDWFKNQVL